MYGLGITTERRTIMPHHYLFFKMIHILGVIVFLGNIIVTGFWKIFADVSNNWRVIAFSQRLVTYTDIVFTTIGVLIIAVTGILMARFYGNFLQVKWIAWGLSLFVASGIIWIAILIPIQIRLHLLVKQLNDNISIPKQYWIYEKIWLGFGLIATLLPLINLYWMVYKPN